MTSGKTLYFAKAILDGVAGGGTWSKPATLYVALSTAVFSKTATGAAMAEVAAANNYSRVAVTNNATNFPNATGATTPASKANGIVVNFPNPSGAWGTITSWYACDAASGGNALFGADLTATKVVVNGDTVSIAIGALVWTEA